MDDTTAVEGVVLLDTPDGGGALERAILERLGHPVIECNGPSADGICPLLMGAPCFLFEQARGIVFELDLDRSQHRAILDRYQELAPADLPIRVVLKPGQRERYADELRDVVVWDHEPSIDDLGAFAAQIEAVERSG
ncbi:MAG: hypothetical protein U5K29_10010 [Acidimicrobiales bacterium]|nr:hypothetical protein [Acidimicrobiales bacterium]